MGQIPPIPGKKPPVPGSNSDSGFLGIVKNTVQGTFTKGLDILSDQWEFERQKDLYKLQLRMEEQAGKANITGWPTGGGVSNAPASGIAFAISPVTLGILGVAGFLLLER
jgi:hypothetical protein